MMYLGDPHNFGKRVYKTNNVIYKPREVFFEWLFLCHRSDLVSFFKNQKLPYINQGILDSFPAIDFYGYNHAAENIEKFAVSFLKIEKQNANTLSHENFACVGYSIAVMAFFGFTDMHFQNIFFGKDEKGKFVFGPIDIECAFEDISLVSQTRLLPTHDFSERDCGLGELKQYMFEFPCRKNICYILLGFIEGLNYLNKNYEEIRRIIKGYNINERKIRVIIKPTRTYYSLLSNFNEAELYDEEKIQLSRGDIPYFFKFLNCKEIFYFDKVDSFIPVKLRGADLEKHSHCIPWIIEENFESNVVNLMQIGCLQLLRFLCPNSNSGVEVVDGLKIAYDIDEIVVEYKDVFSIKTNRHASFKYETKS